MFFVIGLSHSATTLGSVVTGCPMCGEVARQRVDRVRRRLTVFFVPLVPLGVRHQVDCTACGLTREVTEQEAQSLLAGPAPAGWEAAGNGAVTGGGTASEPAAVPPWGTPPR